MLKNNTIEVEEREPLFKNSEQNSYEMDIKSSATSDESCGADDQYLFSKANFNEQSSSNNNNKLNNDSLESTTLTCAVCGDISSGKHYGFWFKLYITDL